MIGNDRGALTLTTRHLPEPWWAGNRALIRRRERNGRGEQTVTAMHVITRFVRCQADIAQHRPLSYKPAN